MLSLEDRTSKIVNYHAPNPAGTLASFEVAHLISDLKDELVAMGNELMLAYPVLVSALDLFETVEDQLGNCLNGDSDGEINVGPKLTRLLEEAGAYRRATEGVRS